MFLGKVIGQAESDEGAGEENQSRLKVVQKLDLYRNASGPSTLAVDFLGADDGDIVIVGHPSASTESGPLPLARNLPPDQVIMGIVEARTSGPVKRRPAG